MTQPKPLKRTQAREVTGLTATQLIRLVERLQKKIALLERQMRILAKEKCVVDRHEANLTGRTAELFVERLLNATATKRNADHDLVVRGRRRLEVKGSACNSFSSGKYWYRRWTWHNFMGVGKQQKSFNRLT